MGLFWKKNEILFLTKIPRPLYNIGPCLLTRSFRLDWSRNPSPSQFHTTNILLHALVTVLYVRFCAGWVSRPTALLAGILFAVHPVHIEAVAGIAGRADVLCTVLFLMCLLKHRERGWTLWTLGLASLSMLAKEQGITVLAVCAVIDVLSGRSGIKV